MCIYIYVYVYVDREICISMFSHVEPLRSDRSAALSPCGRSSGPLCKRIRALFSPWKKPGK